MIRGPVSLSFLAESSCSPTYLLLPEQSGNLAKKWIMSLSSSNSSRSGSSSSCVASSSAVVISFKHHQQKLVSEELKHPVVGPGKHIFAELMTPMSDDGGDVDDIKNFKWR